MLYNICTKRFIFHHPNIKVNLIYFNIQKLSFKHNFKDLWILSHRGKMILLREIKLSQVRIIWTILKTNRAFIEIQFSPIKEWNHLKNKIWRRTQRKIWQPLNGYLRRRGLSVMEWILKLFKSTIIKNSLMSDSGFSWERSPIYHSKSEVRYHRWKIQGNSKSIYFIGSSH